MAGIRALAFVLAFLSAAAHIQATTVFRVTAKLSDTEELLGAGVLVSHELVLTSGDLVSEATQILIQNTSTGARTVAEIKAIKPEAGVAVLSVPGIAGDLATIAKEGPKPGRLVYIRSLGGTQRQGAFLTAFKDEDERDRYRFTIRVGESEAGAPLMNNCDELLAVSLASKDEAGDRQGPGGASGAFPDLVAFLLENEVSVRSAANPCPSLQDQRTEALETGKRLEEEKAALSNEIQELEETIAEGKQRSQEELESLESRRRELAEALRQKDAELATKQSEAARMARLQSELEDRISQGEQDLRAKDKELSAARQREEAAKEQVSYLEGLLIAILIAFSVAVILIAGMAVKRRRRETTQSSASAKVADSDGEPQAPALTYNVGEDRGDALPTQPVTPAQGEAEPSSGDPRTVIAGGFRPRSGANERSSRRGAAHGAVQSTPIESDDPVVGWLVVVDGPGKGTELFLGNGQNTLGRGSDARVQVDFGDTEISRSCHAIVTFDWKSRRFYLQRGTGTNLTYMDDGPVLDPIPLLAGSEFVIGKTTLRFVPFCDDAFTWADAN